MLAKRLELDTNPNRPIFPNQLHQNSERLNTRSDTNLNPNQPESKVVSNWNLQRERERET